MELGAAFTPNKALALSLQGYFGKELPYDGERSFVDFFGTYDLTTALSLAVNLDWGKQRQSIGSDLDWDGIAGYMTYALSDHWRVSLRAEYLNDKDGLFTGTPQKLKEATLTFGFAPNKHFELRIEGRYDKSDQVTFLKVQPSSPDGPQYADEQSEFALQGILKL